ncbi:MAG: hypothetical protein KDB07_03350 [Planctomycetes bacterium]|nr:hypothetical protein [Planctomycetota bacterium]
MPTVSIDAVKPGAVLARSVEDSMGRVLINSGEALSPQLIAVLKKRGFVEVDIRTAATEEASEDPAHTERMTRSILKNMADDSEVIELNKAIEERFHNINPKNPRMGVIKEIARTLLVAKIARKKGLA